METAVVFNAALLPEAWVNDSGLSCAISFRLRPIFSIPSQARETNQYDGWAMFPQAVVRPQRLDKDPGH